MHTNDNKIIIDMTGMTYEDIDDWIKQEAACPVYDADEWYNWRDKSLDDYPIDFYYPTWRTFAAAQERANDLMGRQGVLGRVIRCGGSFMVV